MIYNKKKGMGFTFEKENGNGNGVLFEFRKNLASQRH